MYIDVTDISPKHRGTKTSFSSGVSLQLHVAESGLSGIEKSLTTQCAHKHWLQREQNWDAVINSSFFLALMLFYLLC